MRLNSGLAQLSEEIADRVARAAPMLAAIRIGGGGHLTGIGWPPNLVITADQALPAQESYSIVLPGGAVVAGYVVRRDAALNLTILQVPGAAIEVQPATPEPPSVGALALVMGANADASPTARLTAVYRLDGAGPQELRRAALDSLPGTLAEGSLVLDGAGAVLGLCVADDRGAPTVVAHAAIAGLLGGPAGQEPRRGWIGASLQPVKVPDRLRAAARQATGRLVIGVMRSGPAEQAGVARGDILLALDGESIAGAGTLRALLGPERIGKLVELRLARHGRITTRQLVIAAEPAPG
ncbi:MAG TPA: PDZ domain-containing protein [Acetobacteraceae bacterium]|nr:PDZ domain-containing protein [Acetobacteraceae bacterium]